MSCKAARCLAFGGSVSKLKRCYSSKVDTMKIRRTLPDQSAERCLKNNKVDGIFIQKFKSGQVCADDNTLNIKEKIGFLFVLIDIINSSRQDQELFVKNRLLFYHDNVLNLLQTFSFNNNRLLVLYFYRLSLLDKILDGLVAKQLRQEELLKIAISCADRCVDCRTDQQIRRLFSTLTETVRQFMPFLSCRNVLIENDSNSLMITLETRLISAFKNFIGGIVDDPDQTIFKRQNHCDLLTIVRRCLVDLKLHVATGNQSIKLFELIIFALKVELNRLKIESSSVSDAIRLVDAAEIYHHLNFENCSKNALDAICEEFAKLFIENWSIIFNDVHLSKTRFSAIFLLKLICICAEYDQFHCRMEHVWPRIISYLSSFADLLQEADKIHFWRRVKDRNCRLPPKFMDKLIKILRSAY